MDKRHKLFEVGDANRPEMAPLNAGKVENQNDAANLGFVLEEENIQ